MKRFALLVVLILTAALVAGCAAAGGAEAPEDEWGVIEIASGEPVRISVNTVTSGAGVDVYGLNELRAAEIAVADWGDLLGHDIEVVAEAKSGLECLELLEDVHPDIILMDLHMPVMNGFKTIEHIRNTINYCTKSIVIALTANASPEDKQKAFKQAQLQLMAKYKEPYYWGAFVMIGL